jgi:arsenate reductase
MMKLVVFTSLHDAARTAMAAGFFNAFTLPSLVRGMAGALLHEPPVGREIVEAMSDVGIDAVPPRVVKPEDLRSAFMVVTFADAPSFPVPGVRAERWDVPDPRKLPPARLREVRDRLRERVWKLVAREGWYKLQPASIVARMAAHPR